MPDFAEVGAGLLLVFFLPGFGLTRALFPERRVFRPLSFRGLLEQLASSLVLSVAVTIVVGFAWLGTSPGVQAGWSTPYVEATLAAITAAAFAVAIARGSFSRDPPLARALEPDGSPVDPMEIVAKLDRLAREERRLAHKLRIAGGSSAESEPIQRALAANRAEASQLRSEREAEYARS